MAKCKYCGKSGFFITVSKAGLCKNCHPIVTQSIKRHYEIIAESNQIIEKTKKFDTRIGRIDTIVQNLHELRDRYESKGIEVFEKPISTLLHTVEQEKYDTVKNEAITQVEKLMDKAKLATTLNTKLNNANKALLVLKNFQDEFGYKNNKLVTRISYFIHRSQFDEYIGKAQKEEFKGNVKKALDQYLEALYFIKNDDIEDNLQQEVITDLENKIEQLKQEKIASK